MRTVTVAACVALGLALATGSYAQSLQSPGCSHRQLAEAGGGGEGGPHAQLADAGGGNGGPGARSDYAEAGGGGGEGGPGTRSQLA